MTYPKLKPKIVLLLVFVILGVSGYFVYKQSSDNSQLSANEQIAVEAIKEADIETEDFKYRKPAGWAKLSKEFLDLEAAINGVATAPIPNATFTIAKEPASSSPTGDEELKASTLSTLQKLQDFELISSEASTLDGKSSQNFVYKYSDTSVVGHRLVVVVNDKNVFLLKFASPDADFDKYSSDFDKILASFKFK